MGKETTPKIVAITKFDSWGDIKMVLSLLNGWVFRGQANSFWPLTTSIQRAAQQCNLPKAIIPQMETRVISEFKRRAHNYLPFVPHERSVIDWLTILQHHSGPTRLLNFTYSYYVASFFALENADSEAAVWCVDPIYTHKQFVQNSENVLARITSKKGFIPKTDTICFEKIFASEPGHEIPPGILFIEPDRLSEQMTIQKGIFLVPLNLCLTVEENLAKQFELNEELYNDDAADIIDSTNLERFDFKDYSVIKMCIPREVHRDALYDLEKMNITAATLFPGLDGFTRSLKFF